MKAIALSYEPIIDNMLLSSPPGRRRIEMYIPTDVANQIKKQYEGEGGWEVTLYISDTITMLFE